ncbi:hypothetical protein BC936DRAFT_139328 [Jimgerdemannia flammicorona]|uniref:Uncharacterized protein n=1 Tax=Jimgerdemannia flammicorona TaxID=994334 RepID=A0A433BA41_9FUNG|nr:hypothetical protein BC936DRAFT_139328 [Jimgerdemannia flammicorona]
MKTCFWLSALSTTMAALATVNAASVYVYNQEYYSFGTGAFRGYNIQNKPFVSSVADSRADPNSLSRLLYAGPCDLLDKEGHWYFSSFKSDLVTQCAEGIRDPACFLLSIDDQMACPDTCTHSSKVPYSNCTCTVDGQKLTTHRECCTGRMVWDATKPQIFQESFDINGNAAEYWLPYQVSAGKYYFKNYKDCFAQDSDDDFLEPRRRYSRHL